MNPKDTGATSQNERNPPFYFRFASPELMDKAKRLAKADGRTLTGWINELIRQADNRTGTRTRTQARTRPPDTLTMIARRKLNLPDTYTNCGWTRVDPDGLLVRMKEEYIKTAGKNKGKRGWRGEERTCFVTYAEEKHERASWEKETGKCSNCGGDGQELAGWSAATGTRYKQCRRCNGSGNAQA